jgi:hypothetical protein
MQPHHIEADQKLKSHISIGRPHPGAAVVSKYSGLLQFTETAGAGIGCDSGEGAAHRPAKLYVAKFRWLFASDLIMVEVGGNHTQPRSTAVPRVESAQGTIDCHVLHCVRRWGCLGVCLSNGFGGG